MPKAQTDSIMNECKTKANELVDKSGRLQQQVPSSTGYPNQMNKLAFPLKEKAQIERGKCSWLYTP